MQRINDCGLLLALLGILAALLANAGVSATVSEDAIQLRRFGVAKCRQVCLATTVEDNLTVASGSCNQNWNCLMCVDYCRALSVARRHLALAMCHDRSFCTLGCRIACTFHQIYRLISNDVRYS